MNNNTPLFAQKYITNITENVMCIRLVSRNVCCQHFSLATRLLTPFSGEIHVETLMTSHQPEVYIVFNANYSKLAH